jgi:hypothetical protein
MDDMYNKHLIQQRVVDEMQDSVTIDGKIITTESKSLSSSDELPPSPSTFTDWHNNYEKYLILLIFTTLLHHPHQA